MAELRRNPMTGEWIIIASNRQGRPTMPEDWCPFCPSFGNVPEYEVYKYDNDFPVMSQEFSELSGMQGGIFEARPVYGKCEVILYHPNHTVTLPELPVSHIRKLVNLWCDRYRELSLDKELKYILIFENRGKEAGVTMPHPHGQLYAFNWIPAGIESELECAREHMKKTGNCLVCDLLKGEKEAGVRMVMENDTFAVYVPYATAFPFGTHVVAKRHVGSMNEFTDAEKDGLADILKRITGAYDSLYDKIFPYMMTMHQMPLHSKEDCYHFHIEFYPPLRKDGVQYFRASCETGASTYCNATAPEEKAEELRAAYQKFLSKGI